VDFGAGVWVELSSVSLNLMSFTGNGSVCSAREASLPLFHDRVSRGTLELIDSYVAAVFSIATHGNVPRETSADMSRAKRYG